MRGKIMRIIRAYFTLSNITLRKVVSWTTMRIIRGVRISEGQIIWATPYWFEIVQPMYLAMSAMMTIPTMELYDMEGRKRQQTDLELGFIFEHLDKYFSCNFESMPYEMFNQDSIDLSGSEWKSFTGCMRKETGHGTQYHINKCLSKLSNDCKYNTGTASEAGCFQAKAILDGRTQYNDTTQSHILQSMTEYQECLRNASLDKAVKVSSSFNRSV